MPASLSKAGSEGHKVFSSALLPHLPTETLSAWFCHSVTGQRERNIFLAARHQQEAFLLLQCKQKDANPASRQAGSKVQHGISWAGRTLGCLGWSDWRKAARARPTILVKTCHANVSHVPTCHVTSRAGLLQQQSLPSCLVRATAGNTWRRCNINHRALGA